MGCFLADYFEGIKMDEMFSNWKTDLTIESRKNLLLWYCIISPLGKKYTSVATAKHFEEATGDK